MGTPLPGHVAVANLIARYAELIDDGDLDGLAALFEHAVITGEGQDLTRTGRDEVLALYRSFVRVYDDGTPHTHHVTTNLFIEVDEEAGTAASRAYYTVFQATDDLPLQPIITGRYRDTFERADGAWRFASRHMIVGRVGDMSRHQLGH